MRVPSEFATIGYFVGYGLAVLVAIKLARNWQRDDRLHRGAGQGALRRWEEMTEGLLTRFLVGAGIPPLAGYLTARLLPRLPGSLWIGVGVAGIFVIMAICRDALAASDCYLGYLGERYVGDILAPLTAKGWRIVHDVPCPLGNVDHVAVGPAGVFVIETKARRKRGEEEHEQVVRFDGWALQWPWGIDNADLHQVEDNASWLHHEIKRSRGSAPSVVPILTLPGWWVDNNRGRGERRPGDVWNPKWFTQRMVDAPAVLGPEEIAAIAEFVESRCRVMRA